MGPFGLSAILMVVHSCCVKAELSRLGRLACSGFWLCDAREGVFGDGSGELGELEYDDGEDPASAWIGRWRCSGIVMDVGVLSIGDDLLAERVVGCAQKASRC
jgi:hypothetical protein